MDDLQVKQRIELPEAARGGVLSRNGQHLYIGSASDGVMVLDLQQKRLERVIPTGAPVFDVAVSADEDKLFLAMASGGLRRLSIRSGETKSLSRFACPLFLDMDREGKLLFVSYQCGGPGGRAGHDVVEVYDTASERRLGTIRGLPMVGGPPVVAPGGDLVLLDGLDACVTKTYDQNGCAPEPNHIYYLVRISDLEVVKNIPRPVGTMGAAFSPDGRRLVFGGESLVVMDWARQAVTEALAMPSPSFTFITITRSGRMFVAAGDGGRELLVFDAEDLTCEPSPLGLVNRYSGDGTEEDSGGASALTMSGKVRFTPGLIGQAFKFDGQSVMQAVTGGACWPCAADWTESLFIKWDSGPAEMTFLERAEGNDAWVHRLFKTADNRIVAQVGNPAKPRMISGLSRLGWDTWHHVALVAEGGRRSLYLDGELQGQLNLGTLVDNSRPARGRGVVLIGGGRGRRMALSGLIDELMWHDRALTGKEVKELSQFPARSGCQH